jgi:hypothetical protein
MILVSTLIPFVKDFERKIFLKNHLRDSSAKKEQELLKARYNNKRYIQNYV